ncbi:TTY1B protein, partial [Amia calva]|nr:TTY1B protein [Amia calva]
MATAPGYAPSLWVSLCHSLPRLDLSLRPVDGSFQPHSWDYQQTLLTLSSVSAVALLLSLLVILSFLVHYCCYVRGEHFHSIIIVIIINAANDEDGHTRVNPLSSVAIGIGFYGNSEANDGIYQVTYSLATANHTLASIDFLVSDSVSLLSWSVSGPLTTLEEALSDRTALLVSARSARRLAESLISLLSSSLLPLGGAATPPLPPTREQDRSSPFSSFSLPPSLAPQPPLPPSPSAPSSSSPSPSLPPSVRPFSPGWAADVLAINEDYRWLSYVLLLLLDLVICLFILLGLAKQTRWLLIVMTVLAWMALFLSWGSLGLETATVVALSDFCIDPSSFILNSTQFDTATSPDILEYYLLCNKKVNSPFQQVLTRCQRALSSIHTHLSTLEREAIPEFPQAEQSLSELQRMLNSTEGSFHQLVALLNCRGLNKDYVDSLKGLCYDGMEGLLYLSLYSFLSALSFTAMLCSLPGAWRSFPRESNEYEDSDSESEDPFTSHQARRQTPAGSQRGVLPGFYSYQGAGWTAPFSSAPPLP